LRIGQIQTEKTDSNTTKRISELVLWTIDDRQDCIFEIAIEEANVKSEQTHQNMNLAVYKSRIVNQQISMQPRL
jgi:hypothetical protein